MSVERLAAVASRLASQPWPRRRPEGDHNQNAVEAPSIAHAAYSRRDHNRVDNKLAWQSLTP